MSQGSVAEVPPTQVATDADRRAARQFRDDVRTAKEMLSRTASTTVAVPLFDDTAPLGREELDRLALLVLELTIAAARSVLADAGISRPDGVFLVGGASRTPLVATLLHRAFGVAPTVLDMPELVVAEATFGAAATWRFAGAARTNGGARRTSLIAATLTGRSGSGTR
jgi:molecular chaperone DnaK